MSKIILSLHRSMVVAMKWSFVIQQKLKIASLLGCLIVMVLLANFMWKKHMGSMNKSFSSIYKDRLLPATDIVYLTEHLYNKRLLMEHYLLITEAESEVALVEQMQWHNRQVDSLIHNFESTYLVDQESKSLLGLKNKVEEYVRMENAILALSHEQGRAAGTAMFEQEGKAVFMCTIKHLHELTRIQSEVGKELVGDSQHIVSSTNILSSLEVGLVLIIGLIVQVLIVSSRMVNIKPKNFNMN
ncbi:MCP four helix bundle domain-containing protein [Pontibacter sp. 13R65]|uniref:MCP four helix bundle domain-containing protein n=1 Tax=Pontibacter sp. 13R65 TaxID=3127458 RepID=UPI00301BD67A